MSGDSTENDAEIARILAEEYNLETSSFNPNLRRKSRSCSPVSSKRFKSDDVQQSTTKNCLETDEDGEIAFILQIEEIVLSENNINGKTIKVTDDQLEKTHADMTQALKPTEQTDIMARNLGMFATIQARYANCQTKNQVLIDQIQRLSVQLYPTIIAFKTQGKIGTSKATVPTLAVGLITNVLQGKIKLDDARQILFNMQQIWNDSSVWYEFLEQLVYILVAVTVPSFAQGAMGKIMGKIPSLN